MIHKKDMRIRDPFFVTDKENGCYWLVHSGSAEDRKRYPNCAAFLRRTEDLENFEESIPILTLDGPADGQGGAPEIHYYEGAWYLFTTWITHQEGVETGAYPPGKCKGTAIFRSEKLTGPYEMWTDGPPMAPDIVNLDGTLFVDKKGQPWMVYCHEWIQIHDGTVEAIPLTKDLKAAAGEPIVLFHGSEAPWTKPDYIVEYRGTPVDDETYVTDAPFLFYDKSGALCTLWSTGGESIYKTGIVRSADGTIEGKWEHLPEPIYDNDGGHGMIFTDLNGQLCLSIHQPNEKILATNERLHVLPAEITECGLSIDLSADWSADE